MRLETETTVFKKDSVKDAIKNKVVHGANPTGDFQVGDTWFNPNEGYKMYSWNGTGWSPEQLDTDAIKAGAIKAENIYTGAITADKIGANEITVDKLVVGDMSNLATVNEWDPGSMATYPEGYESATQKVNNTTGLMAIVKAADANTHLALSNGYIPNIFKTGDEIYYSLRARAVSTARTVYLMVAAYAKSGDTYSRLGDCRVSLSLNASSYTKYTGTIVLEDGQNWAWSNNSSNYTIATHYMIYILDNNGSGDQVRLIQVEIRKKNSGDIITGGTIEGGRIRTPLGPSYEMIHVDNHPSNVAYWEFPLPTGNDDTYMQLVQSGVESLTAAKAVKSYMASVLLKLYQTDDSASHLIETIYGWYLSGMLYSPRIFTERGEVATLAQNDGQAVINQSVDTFTPDNVSAWSTLGNCWYYKIGTRVHLHAAVTGLTANTNTVIYTFTNSGYAPYATVVAAGRGNDGSTFCSMWVDSSGVVTVRSTGTNAAVDIEYDAFN